MLEIMKKLATLLIILSFMTISCAVTTAWRFQSLGGNPRVETIKSTIGMSLADLDNKLGTPNGSDVCTLPFKSKGQEIMAQGKSFLWEHEVINMKAGTFRSSSIMVCTVENIVVWENRQWTLVYGNITSMGEEDSINFPLLKTIMDNLLKPGKEKILPDDYNKYLEI